MKRPMYKRLLVLGLALSLSLPATAFANEPSPQSNSTDLHFNQQERILNSPNLLIRESLYEPSRFVQQDRNAEKGPVIKSKKQQDRFEQNAYEFVTDLHTGNYKQALKSTSRALKKSISEQWLEIYWTTLLQQFQAQFGAFYGFGKVEMEEINRVHTNVKIELQFERATIPFIVRMERSGKVDDFLLNQSTGPFASEPEYSNPEAFTEKEVVIGKGDFALPGTLSIPRGKGPFPVVVLVHGSGASNEDEAVFAFKPFRDLTHGLVSKGIAVLRYNKRTYEHSVKITADPNHTVDKETTDDALLATRLLEKEKRIDDEQIYVLGHSQGGMMVPQMINQDKRQNTGAIIMGGPARTIQDVVLDQFDYLLSTGQILPQVYEFYTTQYEMLNDPDFSGENPPEGFQLGQAMFWDSINDIRAAEMAKDQSEPLLIIQGERDYQVLSDVEIPIWKEELSHRHNVEYKLYPKLNHFFTEGKGEMSTPQEYMTPANIPEYVINDIAEWVKSDPKGE
nr:alpha/beta fold hydrolase [Pseudalkalibacillus decolorationis]